MGEFGQLGETSGSGKRVRTRTVLRWVPPGLAVAALVVSMVTVVQRGEDGRKLSLELDRLEAEAEIVADRIATERARVDSLTTLSRIEEVAGSLGLRRAGDEELVQVEAVAAPDPDEMAGSEVGGER